MQSIYLLSRRRQGRELKFKPRRRGCAIRLLSRHRGGRKLKFKSRHCFKLRRRGRALCFKSHTHLPLRRHAFIFIIAAYCSLLHCCTHLHRCANARSSSSLRLYMHRNVFLFPGTLFGNRTLFPYFAGHYTLTISHSLISHSFFMLPTSGRDNNSTPTVPVVFVAPIEPPSS